MNDILNCTVKYCSSISETVRNRIYVHFLNRLIDTTASQNTDLSSWDILYIIRTAENAIKWIKIKEMIYIKSNNVNEIIKKYAEVARRKETTRKTKT
jgi:hypothetical protein